MKKNNWHEKLKNSKLGKMISNTSMKTLSLVLLFLFLAFLNVSQSLTIVQLQYKNADLNEKMFDFQNENKVLTEKLEKVGTDQYVEEKARERLGMVKSGETPIKVYETVAEVKKEKTHLEPKDKIGIYMKDWYVKLEDWISYLKKK